MSLAPSDKFQVRESIIMSLANVDILTQSTIMCWDDIVEYYCMGIDEAIEKIGKENQPQQRLFSIEEETCELSLNQGQPIPEINPLSLSDDLENEMASEFAQKLSIIKCDKNDEERRRSQIEQFIDSSTLDDMCGEAMVISSQAIFIDNKKPSVKKSIQIQTRSLPSFEQEKENSDMDNRLNVLRQEFNSMKTDIPPQENSCQTPVRYILTEYSSNESSNIDQYSYRWKDSEIKDSDEEIDEDSVPSNYYPLKDHQVHSPKKKRQRLYCNSKKIPHWAEDMKKLKEKLQQQNLKPPFGEFNQQILHEVLFPGRKPQKRGSSAQWKRNSQQRGQALVNSQKKMMSIMQEIHDESINALKSNKKSVKSPGIAKKFIELMKSVQKKIFS